MTSMLSGGRSVSTSEVIDRSMNQCLHRGLFDTAGWLAQLALDATDAVLREPIPSSSTVAMAVQDPPLTGRTHRHHVVALGLMQKGEYLRCHHHLSTALQEMAEESQRQVPRSHPSRQTQTPQLQFLCLYALYMDGERVKSTNSNPHKSTNPHLRMLRGLLLAALEQAPAAPSMAWTSPSNGPARSPSTSSASSRPPMKPPTPSTVQRASPIAASAHTGNTAGASASLAGVGAYGDPFLCWLHGVVLRELGMKQESATYFLAALCSHPLLWCAWEDLCTLVSRENQIEEIEAMITLLEPRFMSEIFLASVKAALNVAPLSFVASTAAPTNTNTNTTTQRSGSPLPHGMSTSNEYVSQSGAYAAPQHPPRRESPAHFHRPLGSTGSGEGGTGHARLANSWEVLLEQFPNNLFLLTNLAGYCYNVKKDLEKAHTIYKRLHAANPHRLEGMDDYSIVLFLRGDRIGLSSLAQQVYHVDPFRAESNFVVGNYYVLMGAHDRGVLHFRRAVAADPTFLAAWTLLGHAYLETKNSAAAVEAYRTAVDLDQRDYRGWYNLGQIYELLQFYHHALYYYWHTTTLRPTDPRMWSAVANCLDREGRGAEAMLCLERAEAYESASSDFYPPLARRLGAYYLGVRRVDRAMAYLEKLLASEAKRREDVLFAVPHVVPYHLQQARQLLDPPARAPSCDAGPFTAAGPSSAAQEWIAGDAAARRAVEARWEQAAACLAAAEGHLETWAAALGVNAEGKGAPNTPSTISAHSAAEGGVGGADEGRNRQAAGLARYYQELRALGRYLHGQRQVMDSASWEER